MSCPFSKWDKVDFILGVQNHFDLIQELHQNKICGRCNMIKGNESDAGNIDFELQAKKKR